MIKRLILRLFAGVALAFAPAAEAATTDSVPTIQDLLDTCADPSAAAKAACAAYVNATIQTADIMSAVAGGGKQTPMFCLSAGMRPEDLVAVVRIQLTAHPDRKAFPAPTALIGGAVDAFPCAKPAARTPAPAHRSTARRAHR